MKLFQIFNLNYLLIVFLTFFATSIISFSLSTMFGPAKVTKFLGPKSTPAIAALQRHATPRLQACYFHPQCLNQCLREGLGMAAVLQAFEGDAAVGSKSGCDIL